MVVGAVDMWKERLPRIGAVRHEYGDSDILIGHIVVYAATIIVVRIVCVDSSAGQSVTVDAQPEIVTSCVV